MKHIFKIRFHLATNRGIADIVANYTEVTGCDRVKEVAK